MARGDKSSYSDKQKRQAEHIEEGYKHRGVSTDEAEKRAWATVNKETGGGKKSGSGRGKAVSRTASRAGGRKAAASGTGARKTAAGGTGRRKASSGGAGGRKTALHGSDKGRS